jgi:hypothetical protein
MGPVYARISALLGPDGAMYAYFDDLVSDPIIMSLTLAAAPTIYKKVVLRICGAHGKTKLSIPPDCDPEAFLL